MYWRTVDVVATDSRWVCSPGTRVVISGKGLLISAYGNDPGLTVRDRTYFASGKLPILRIGGIPLVLRVAAAVSVLAVLAISTPAWLPWFGTALAVDEPLAAADVALVLEGTGATATDAAEAWRQQGLIRDVVIVEAPVKTHAL